MTEITFHYRYRKQIIIGLIILVFIIISVYLIITYYPKSESKSTTTIASIQKKEPPSDEIDEGSTNLYKVDIKGEVMLPGIYTMKESSRIIDVIEAAGGLTEEANTTVLNLSKKITDEMVIIVYSNEEVANFAKTKEIEAQVQEQCQQKDEVSLQNAACIGVENNLSSQTVISINTATIEELMALPGIGEAKAQDIIDYRTTNGPFSNIEDLKNVPGIGDSLFAKIKDYITI